MSLVGGAIRRALGRYAPAAAPAARQPFFGTYSTLLTVFGAAIRHAQALEQARLSNVSRRRGVSAGSAYARAKGTLPHPPRRGKATGRGSYSECSPQQAVQACRALGFPTSEAHRV